MSLLLARKARIYVAAVDAIFEVHEEAVERLARAEVVQLRSRPEATGDGNALDQFLRPNPDAFSTVDAKTYLAWAIEAADAPFLHVRIRRARPRDDFEAIVDLLGAQLLGRPEHPWKRLLRATSQCKREHTRQPRIETSRRSALLKRLQKLDALKAPTCVSQG